MAEETSDLTVRPISGPEELDLFNQIPYVLNEEVAGDLAAGRRHTQWMWMALRDDRLVARLAWWARAGRTEPMVLDIFDFEDVSDGIRLVHEAMAKTVASDGPKPEYSRFVTPHWRDSPQTRQPVEQRMFALQQTGASLFVERLRLEWTPGTPIAEPTGRLTFRPADDRDELIGLMAQVLDGTLDAYSRADLTRMTAMQAAAQQYQDEFMTFTTPREWWQIAMLPGGEPVGFVIPARNAYHPIIAYVGVLPKHRGHGYIDEVLAEGVRILAAQDVPRIRAATDLGNVPMARAFERAGFVNFERQIDMTWS
ncbi:MAG TPA: GNAT family N-acetyltransferase [Candidatus Limnocylindrales bacterium]